MIFRVCLYICSIVLHGTQMMVQIQNISGYKTALLSGEIQRRETVVLRACKPDIGFYNLFFPVADYIEPESKMYRVRNLNKITKSMQRVQLLDIGQS